MIKYYTCGITINLTDAIKALSPEDAKSAMSDYVEEWLDENLDTFDLVSFEVNNIKEVK